MLSEKKLLNSYIKKIEKYVRQGGPEEYEWDDLTNLINEIHIELNKKSISENQMKSIYKSFGDSLSNDTLQGHIINKPYGYSGDFLLIDKLYTLTIINGDKYIKWDNFVYYNPGVIALRNRKSFFKSLLGKIDASPERTSILNIASGPCRDIHEYFTKNPNSEVYFDCVEFDIKAIDYAKSILDGTAGKVNFINKNAIRFTTEKKYDLIWSGGLFDYFEDKVFIRLLKRYAGFLKENAEIVIGNFHPSNPSKAYMELMNWHLYYRDEEHLLKLAKECGLNMNNVRVDSEPMGINLFLHYKNVT